MNPEWKRLCDFLSQLARSVSRESPRRFSLLSVETPPQSTHGERQCTLELALLGDALPEGSPYHGYTMKCELRFCITDCGPITCKAFRILDDVHHPNFVPRVGACRCHPEFLPSLYKGTFRPSLLLDEVWDRLQHPVLEVSDQSAAFTDSELFSTGGALHSTGGSSLHPLPGTLGAPGADSGAPPGELVHELSLANMAGPGAADEPGAGEGAVGGGSPRASPPATAGTSPPPPPPHAGGTPGQGEPWSPQHLKAPSPSAERFIPMSHQEDLHQLRRDMADSMGKALPSFTAIRSAEELLELQEAVAALRESTLNTSQVMGPPYDPRGDWGAGKGLKGGGPGSPGRGASGLSPRLPSPHVAPKSRGGALRHQVSLTAAGNTEIPSRRGRLVRRIWSRLPCGSRTDVIKEFQEEPAKFWRQAREMAVREHTAEPIFKRKAEERALEKALLDPVSRDAWCKDIEKIMRTSDRAAGAEHRARAHRPTVKSQELFSSPLPVAHATADGLFNSACDIVAPPPVDTPVEDEGAGRRRREAASTAHFEDGSLERLRGDAARPVDIIELRMVKRRQGAVVEIDNGRGQKWRHEWGGGDRNNYSLLMLSRKDLRVLACDEYSLSHPTGLKKLLQALDRPRDAIVCLYSSRWREELLRDVSWMSSVGVDALQVFDMCGSRLWRLQAERGASSQFASCYGLLGVPGYATADYEVCVEGSIMQGPLETYLIWDDKAGHYDLMSATKMTHLEIKDLTQAADEDGIEMEILQAQAHLFLHRPAIVKIFGYYALYGAANYRNPYTMGSRAWSTFCSDCKLGRTPGEADVVFKETNFEGEMREMRVGIDRDSKEKEGGGGGRSERLRKDSQDDLSKNERKRSKLAAMQSAQVSEDANPDREMMMDEFMEGIVRMGVRSCRGEGLSLGQSTDKVMRERVLPHALRMEPDAAFDRRFHEKKVHDVLSENRLKFETLFRVAKPSWMREVTTLLWVDFLRRAEVVGPQLTPMDAVALHILTCGGAEKQRDFHFDAFLEGLARCARELYYPGDPKPNLPDALRRLLEKAEIMDIIKYPNHYLQYVE